MNDTLNQNRTKVFECISELVRSKGIPPTVDEVAKAAGLCFSKTRRCMITLEKFGYIKRYPNKMRGISVLVWPEEVKAAA